MGLSKHLLVAARVHDLSEYADTMRQIEGRQVWARRVGPSSDSFAPCPEDALAWAATHPYHLTNIARRDGEFIPRGVFNGPKTLFDGRN